MFIFKGYLYLKFILNKILNLIMLSIKTGTVAPWISIPMAPV